MELVFRNIKTTMGMETLSCKSPEMVKKEIWVYVLAYRQKQMVCVDEDISKLCKLIAENTVGNRPRRRAPRSKAEAQSLFVIDNNLGRSSRKGATVWSSPKAEIIDYNLRKCHSMLRNMLRLPSSDKLNN